MNVTRLLGVAARGERRSAAASRYRLGLRVAAAREPKLLRAATRLAAARGRAPWAASVAGAPAFGAVSPAAAPGAPALMRVPAPAAVPGAPEFGPVPSVSAPVAPSSAPVAQRLVVARATKPGASPPAPPASSPAPAPAITAESLGIGPASFEWLFGDPDKALAHPDVTPGPLVSLPPMSPAERSARRVARLTARGGSPYGRGARINEGPRKQSEPPATLDVPAGAELPVMPQSPTRSELAARSESPAPETTAAPAVQVARATASDRPASAGAAAPSPAAPEPAPFVEPTPPVLQRVARDPAPRASSSPRPARQRLVAGRRPAAARAAREIARVADAPVPLPKPPPPPSPGPPSVRPITRQAESIGDAAPVAPATPARPEIARRHPKPTERPTIHRAPRPAPAPPPAPPRPSLFRRALAALKPGPAPVTDFGDLGDLYRTPAPKSEPPVARMTLGTPWAPHRPTLPPQPAARLPEAPAGFSPPPPLRALAQRSSQPLVRASADLSPEPPTTTPPQPQTTPPAPTAAPTPAGDPDGVYRDLLTRVREEREQLGQLISHPF